jgi:WD40 repeat protein
VALVDLPDQKVNVLDSVLNNSVDALAFSPDGDLLAADNGHAVMFENLDSDTPTVRDLSRFTRPAGAPAGADLSPDGGTMAISAGGTVSFIDLATEEVIGSPVRVSDDAINWLAYAPDGSMITTSDLGHSARLIDVASHQLVGPMLPINGFTGPVFSGDSKTLGTSSRFSGAFKPSSGALLSVDPTVWREQACALAGRNLTEDEWARYLPEEGPRQATCPAYP